MLAKSLTAVVLLLSSTITSALPINPSVEANVPAADLKFKSPDAIAAAHDVSSTAHGKVTEVQDTTTGLVSRHDVPIESIVDLINEFKDDINPLTHELESYLKDTATVTTAMVAPVLEGIAGKLSKFTKHVKDLGSDVRVVGLVNSVDANGAASTASGDAKMTVNDIALLIAPAIENIQLSVKDIAEDAPELAQSVKIELAGVVHLANAAVTTVNNLIPGLAKVLGPIVDGVMTLTSPIIAHLFPLGMNIGEIAAVGANA